MPISGRCSSSALMVLLSPPDGSSARPPGNVCWHGDDDRSGALFDGRKGTIALVNAFSRGWTVVFARVVGDIVSMRRLKLRPCSTTVAETI